MRCTRREWQSAYEREPRPRLKLAELVWPEVEYDEPRERARLIA